MGPLEHARILVVDDNAQLADNLSEILTGAGCVVRTATTCTQARAILGLKNGPSQY